jgi:hypothetical protein
LDALAAPPGWRSSQQGLRGAVRAMTDVTATMRTRDKVKDPVALNSDLIDIDDAALVSAELDWQKALRATFARRHQKAPATPQTGSARHPVATLSGWTFAADRSCFAGMLHSQPYLRRLDQRDTDTAAMRAGATILRRTAKQLQGLDRPSRTATLRREVLLRLPSVLATADAIRDVANGIDRLDLTALNSAVDRLHTLLPQIKVLGGGFRSLHVTACATFFGSKDVSGSSGRSLAA